MTDNVPVRDAATIVLVRDPATTPSILMGRRGGRAVFMPGKVVFPGGRVDPGDAHVRLAAPLSDPCHTRLQTTNGPAPETLAAAAIRELWEETGQRLCRPGVWTDVPTGWTAFAMAGLRPDASALRFVFRAITPPGPPRRFDARFFTADASALATDPDDLSAAGPELSDLRWIDLDEARRLDLPFVTRAVLDHVSAHLPDLGPHDVLPFFREGDEARAMARQRQGYTA